MDSRSQLTRELPSPSDVRYGPALGMRKGMTKADFVRTRPLDEPWERVVELGKKAGHPTINRQDIYMARKGLANRLALLKAKEKVTGEPVNLEPEPEPEKPRIPPPPDSEPKPERRKPRSSVPGAHTDMGRIHSWLDAYVRQHDKGPPSIQAVATATGVKLESCGTALSILRRAGIIDYVSRDLRTLRVLREPAEPTFQPPRPKLPTPSAPLSEPPLSAILSIPPPPPAPTEPPPAPPEPEPAPAPPPITATANSRVGPSDYLMFVTADLGRILSQQLLDKEVGVDVLAKRIEAVRTVIDLLSDTA